MLVGFKIIHKVEAEKTVQCVEASSLKYIANKYNIKKSALPLKVYYDLSISTEFSPTGPSRRVWSQSCHIRLSHCLYVTIVYSFHLLFFSYTGDGVYGAKDSKARRTSKFNDWFKSYDHLKMFFGPLFIKAFFDLEPVYCG